MLVCSDLERSLHFYRDVLGLRVTTDASPVRIDFALGTGVCLSVHARNDLLVVRPGSLQLGLSVRSVDSFLADCRQLGVPVFQDAYNEPYGRIAVIGDPDGYPIQLGSNRRKS